GGAARGGDLLGRLAAELVRAHRELLTDVAARQHLDLLSLAADQPLLPEQFGRDHGAGIKTIRQRVKVHHRVLGAELVVEAALGGAAVQRHLAAFEPALELEARTRLRALVAAPRLRAGAGAVPAPD